jgi:hypothetical protein
MRNDGSRYREGSRRLLPKFGSGGARLRGSGQEVSVPETRPLLQDAASANVDRQEAEASKAAGAVRTGPALLTRAKSFWSAGASATRRVIRLKSDAAKSPKPALASPFSQTPKTAERPQEAGSTGGVLGKITAWVKWGRKSAGRMNADAAKTPVQCEFSLDTVRVVRNDLSDADVEVVAARPPAAKPEAPKPATEPARPMAEPAQAAETAWGRVTEQMFGAGKN